jgi:hypothetical protein
MDGSTNLCQISKTGHEDDWKNLYESSFPADERHPVDDLRKLITGGTVILHRTTNKAGELLCFSIVNVMSDFSLLAYIATDSTKRSTGVGSKHMKKLIEELKTAHPTHVGMFLEIESTKEAGLDADTHKARARRLAFYQRLGAKRMHKSYLMPSYGTAQGTAEARQGELLWVEFTASCITEATLPRIIEEIFCKAYGLPNTDKTVQKVLSGFNSSDSNATKCAAETETASPSSTTSGAEAKPTESTVSQAEKPAAAAETEKPGQTPSKTNSTDTPAETPAKTDETVKPAETPVKTDETVKPAETPVKTEETVKPAETPVKTEETVKPAETPVKTEETFKPAETPAKTEETVKPAETPAKTEETVKPAETPAKTEETVKPAETPVATGDAVQPAVSDSAPAA